MNAKYRYLPSLNCYFLQKQALQKHRNKIMQIMRSISKSRLKINSQKGQACGENSIPISSPKYSIDPIAEESINHNKPQRRLSPRAKRNMQNIRAENKRLLDRIQKSRSTINRKDIKDHILNSKVIKQRLSRFSESPFSHKVIFKCKKSLQLMKQHQFRKELSNSMHKEHLLRSVQIKSAKKSQSRLHSDDCSISRKSSLDQFYQLKSDWKSIKSSSQKRLRPVVVKRKDSLNDTFWNQSKAIHNAQPLKLLKIFATQIDEV